MTFSILTLGRKLGPTKSILNCHPGCCRLFFTRPFRDDFSATVVIIQRARRRSAPQLKPHEKTNLRLRRGACGEEGREWEGRRGVRQSVSQSVHRREPAHSAMPPRAATFVVRELPHMMSAKFLDFLTPSPRVRIWIWFTPYNSLNLPYYVRLSVTPFPPLMRTSYLEDPSTDLYD